MDRPKQLTWLNISDRDFEWSEREQDMVFAAHNPMVRCPECNHEAPLMEGFSLLKSGFNGVKRGDSDDLDLQECGNCGSKLDWTEPNFPWIPNQP